MKYYSVKPQLSGLVGTGLNGPDKRDNRMIENMNINEPRTKLNNLETSNQISHSNRANLSQSKLRNMHYISFGACEHEIRSDLCFEAKQIQSAPKFHHIIAADTKYEKSIFMKNWDQRRS